MKLPPKFKPHLVVAEKDDERNLDQVCFRSPFVIATDRRMAVIGILQDKPMDVFNQMVPAEACKRAVAKTKNESSASITFSKDAVDVQEDENTRSSFYSEKATRFPKLNKTVPHHTSMTASVRLNVKLLKKLADALGDEVVELTFPVNDPHAPIIVVNKMDDRFGLLMPVKTEIPYNKAYFAFRKQSE